MTFSCQIESDRAVLRQNGHAEAEIYFFGALLNRYAVFGGGEWLNCIAAYRGTDDAQQHITDGFRSAKLSPFPCRLNRGGYRFDGREYQTGRHVLNGHAIHGLLYDAPFASAGHGSGEDAAWIELAYAYPADQNGFPFPYRLTVRYTLSSDGLTVSTTAENTGTAPMPLADGWHPYFTLGGTADDWTLQIDGGTQLEFDADLLPTGARLADNRFAEATSLRGIELDNSFELNGNGGARPACTLRHGARRLDIFAEENYPLLQIYIPPERTSIALENLSGAPDCFNNGIGLTILPPGGEKRFTARYRLDVSS